MTLELEIDLHCSVLVVVLAQKVLKRLSILLLDHNERYKDIATSSVIYHNEASDVFTLVIIHHRQFPTRVLYISRFLHKCTISSNYEAIFTVLPIRIESIPSPEEEDQMACILYCWCVGSKCRQSSISRMLFSRN